MFVRASNIPQINRNFRELLIYMLSRTTLFELLGIDIQNDIFR